MTTTSKSIKVSIIVPCYNYGRFLDECLNSVLAQTLREFECLIIDNGSTDNTREIASRFCQKDTRFHYHYMEQNGVSAARNFGIRHSTGLYILPLDADDRIGPRYLEEAAAVLDADNSVKVVYSNAELFGAMNGPWSLPDYSFRELLIENLIFSSGLFRRSDVKASGGYNENMREGFEDWDFWINLLKSGGKVHRLPGVHFYYRIREGSRNNSLGEEKQLRLRRQVFEHHKTEYESHFKMPELLFDYYKLRAELDSLKGSRSYKAASLISRIMQPLKKPFGN